MENQRTRLTKKLFHNGLLECLKEENFDHISVRSICKKSELNRSTFYLHYQDKYELLNEIENEIIKESEKAFAYDENRLYKYLKFIKANKELYKVLLLNSREFEKKIISNSIEVIKNVTPFDKNSKMSEYVYRFLIEGGMAVIKEWVYNDCRQSEDKMSNLIYTITNKASKNLKI